MNSKLQETSPRPTSASAVQVDEPNCSDGSQRAKGNKSEVAGEGSWSVQKRSGLTKETSVSLLSSCRHTADLWTNVQVPKLFLVSFFCSAFLVQVTILLINGVVKSHWSSEVCFSWLRGCSATFSCFILILSCDFITCILFWVLALIALTCGSLSSCPCLSFFASLRSVQVLFSESVSVLILFLVWISSLGFAYCLPHLWFSFVEINSFLFSHL